MIRRLDRFLNGVTMYRLILVWLAILVLAGLLFAWVGLLPYSAANMLASALFLLAVSIVSNTIFARVFEAATSNESVYITALILALIISPVATFANLPFLACAAVLATASKYIIAPRRRHIFNPAAFAVVMTSLFLNHSASWWVGNLPMLPIVLVGGILIVRKMRRSDLIWAFFITVLLTLLAFVVFAGTQLIPTIRELVVHSPLLFFAFVMLTEPLTTPPSRALQLWYGALVGLLFVPQVHLRSFYFTPEIALLVGNVFSYVVSPKTNLMLSLKETRKLAPNTYEFVFHNDQQLRFRPGQYMEWTLPHDGADSRGNRRFFTLSSSPTEREVKIGVKFHSRPSSFKRHLLNMKTDDRIAAGHLAGDFVLPKAKGEKIAFIAGGIGITPFKSMIRYMLDSGDRRAAVVLYANRRIEDIAYDGLLEQASKWLGIRTVHILTDPHLAPLGWDGRTGHIDEDLIREEVPDYRDRIFYVSGPPDMVAAARRAIAGLGVKPNRIRTDYFPGFA